MLRLGELIEHLYPSITVYAADFNSCPVIANSFLVISVPILFTLRGQQVLSHYEDGDLPTMLKEFQRHGAKMIQNSVLTKIRKRAPPLPSESSNKQLETSREPIRKIRKSTPHGCLKPLQCKDALCQILMEIDSWTDVPAKDGDTTKEQNDNSSMPSRYTPFCVQKSNTQPSDDDRISAIPSTAVSLNL